MDIMKCDVRKTKETTYFVRVIILMMWPKVIKGVQHLSACPLPDKKKRGPPQHVLFLPLQSFLQPQDRARLSAQGYRPSPLGPSLLRRADASIRACFAGLARRLRYLGVSIVELARPTGLKRQLPDTQVVAGGLSETGGDLTTLGRSAGFEGVEEDMNVETGIP